MGGNSDLIWDTGYKTLLMEQHRYLQDDIGKLFYTSVLTYEYNWGYNTKSHSKNTLNQSVHWMVMVASLYFTSTFEINTET